MKKNTAFTLVLSLSISLCCFADTIHVPGDQPTIQDGIDAALNGDVVLVAPGTYMENLVFNGKAVTVKSSGGPVETIIDGGYDGSAAAFVDGETNDSVLEGFTLTNGNGTWVQLSPGTGARFGGGVLCLESSPKVLNNIIEDNDSYFGGGVACKKASPVIDGNVIRGNHSTGISCRDNSSPTISNNFIIENTSNAGGGGISCVLSSDIHISGNTISDNSAIWVGGGFSSETCSNITFTDNVVSDNYCIRHGGGVSFSNTSPVTFNGNIVLRNVVGNAYGGVHVSECLSVHMANNIVADNFVSEKTGGGVAIFKSNAHLVNNTITGNKAREAGGGLRCMHSIVTMVNSILWANDAIEGSELWIGYVTAASNVSVRNSVVQGGEAEVFIERPSELIWGAGMIDADPCFVDPAADDYHLAFRSPCIGAGYNDAYGLPAYDFEGDPRNFFNVDIGADEFHVHLYSKGDCVSGGSIDLKIVGFPGNWPVGLFVGSGVMDPPLQHPWGLFYLEAPWFFYPLVPIPSNGVLVMPSMIPSAPGGYDVPLQALVGSKLSNLLLLKVE